MDDRMYHRVASIRGNAPQLQRRRRPMTYQRECALRRKRPPTVWFERRGCRFKGRAMCRPGQAGCQMRPSRASALRRSAPAHLRATVDAHHPPSHTHSHTHATPFATRRRAVAPCHNPLLPLGGSARKIATPTLGTAGGAGVGATAKCRHARAHALFAPPHTARARRPLMSVQAQRRGGAAKWRGTPSPQPRIHRVRGATCGPASLSIAYAARMTARGTARSALAVRSLAPGWQPRRAIARPIDHAARQPASQSAIHDA